MSDIAGETYAMTLSRRCVRHSRGIGRGPQDFPDETATAIGSWFFDRCRIPSCRRRGHRIRVLVLALRKTPAGSDGTGREAVLALTTRTDKEDSSLERTLRPIDRRRNRRSNPGAHVAARPRLDREENQRSPLPGSTGTARDLPVIVPDLGTEHRFPIDAALTIEGTFRGIELSIRDAAIIGVASGKCDVSVQLKLSGYPVGNPTIAKELPLPGDHRFEPALAIL